ncbi:MAG: serine/threonine protein kinase [Deltaproteobacteria bacterium]|nr:serine/threonine protein kinase [Deltaproteobacteria bacterium]
MGSGLDNAASDAAIDDDLAVGEFVGGYRILGLLARGGSGSVFRAERLRDRKRFALKMLSSSKAGNARVVSRFINEVRAAALVRHRCLVRVVDIIEQQNPRRIGSVMEFVSGETLRAQLETHGPLTLHDAILVAEQICDAISVLHGAGIVHRDLKPENIMLLSRFMREPPRIKVLDFGVVKFLRSETSPESTVEDARGLLVGTPRYMAPEQAAGFDVDERADVFSVGVLLFEMISGRCPHEGESLREVMLAKLEAAPRIVMTSDREILPQELSDLVDACLSADREARPKSAREVMARLQEARCVLSVVGPVHAEGASPAASSDGGRGSSGSRASSASASASSSASGLARVSAKGPARGASGGSSGGASGGRSRGGDGRLMGFYLSRLRSRELRALAVGIVALLIGLGVLLLGRGLSDPDDEAEVVYVPMAIGSHARTSTAQPLERIGTKDGSAKSSSGSSVDEARASKREQRPKASAW